MLGVLLMEWLSAVGLESGGAGLILLAAIMATAGFMSGLSGFGFSAVGAASFWVLPPVYAVPLLMALSVPSQLLSLRQLRSELMPWGRWWPNGPAPFVLGGVAGMLPGVWLLLHLDPLALSVLVGFLLLGYASWSHFMPTVITVSHTGPAPSIAVGFVGGVIGGFTAFPGCAVVIWAVLIGMPKQKQRGIVQPYILCMQLLALSILALTPSQPSPTGAVMVPPLWMLFLIMLPLVLGCTALGVRTFRKLSDFNFKKVTLGLLGLSGVALMMKGLVNF